MKYIQNAISWVIDQIEEMNHAHSLTIEKQGYGWAIAEFTYGHMKVNDLIGVYETARANGRMNDFHRGIRTATNHIKRTTYETFDPTELIDSSLTPHGIELGIPTKR